MAQRTVTLEERKRRTSRVITVRAQELADAHGLDGFTMDDLAAAADVSRRTLFNYFPGKLDAVLGATPTLSAETVGTFTGGGPHGHLVDDLAELARALLDVDDLTRRELELGQRVFLANPRLMIAAHERFESLTAEFATLILEREGAGFGRDRALLLVRLLVSVFDCCLPTSRVGSPSVTSPDDDRPLAEVFTETLATARSLLA